MEVKGRFSMKRNFGPLEYLNSSTLSEVLLYLKQG